MWTTGKEIREAKEDKEALECVVAFQKLHRFGLPYSGGFAENPARIVEIMDMLGPLYDLYHPGTRLG